MAEPNPQSAARPPLDALQAIDAACDRFEAQWQTGQPPALVEHLGEAPPELHRRLLPELLAIELEYRRGEDGRRLTAGELLALHPTLPADAAAEFCRLPTVRGDTPSPASGLHVRCPHCQNAVELLDGAPLEAITCRSCGSAFTLVGDGASDEASAPTLKRVGRFELQTLLGVGGFGAVWRARDTDLDRMVAVKIPRRGSISRSEAELFFREARAAAQLRHPHIVPVHEVGRDGPTIFIVSELIRGVPLSERLEAPAPTFRETATLLSKVADALAAAHRRGVVHRDLKPSNVMLDDHGEPHLMDFGLAKRQSGEVTMTVDGQVLGTPAYMSPEQAAGRTRWIDRRTDLYSLGVVLFQMLTGELPFRGSLHSQLRQRLEDDPPHPRRLNLRVPEDLATICLKCLQREPHRRYATAEEVAEEFRRYLRGEPLVARPISRWARAARWARRRPASAAAIGLAAVLAVAGPAAAAVIESQRRAIQLRLAERDELLARRQAAANRDAARIASLERDNRRLLATLPEETAPLDWRRTLAREYLLLHYEPLAKALPAEAAGVAAEAHLALGQLLRLAGRAAEAPPHYRRARRWLEDAGDPRLAGCLEALRDLATELGQPAEAARYASRARALRAARAETDPGPAAQIRLLAALAGEARRRQGTQPAAAPAGPIAAPLRELAQTRDAVRRSWSASPASVVEVAAALAAPTGRRPVASPGQPR